MLPEELLLVCKVCFLTGSAVVFQDQTLQIFDQRAASSQLETQLSYEEIKQQLSLPFDKLRTVDQKPIKDST